MTELESEGTYLNLTHGSNTRVRRHAGFWIAAMIVVLTFVMLDASALAWSAAVIDGRQFAVEIFTFVVVASGAAITVWKMRAN